MADVPDSRSSSQRLILVLGSIVLIIGCLYWAQKILIPLTLAIFLAFVLSPLVVRLQRLGLGRIPAVVLVVIVAFSFLACICWAVTSQLRNLLDELPQHRQEIAVKIEAVRGSGPGPWANLLNMAHDVAHKVQVNAPPSNEGKEPQPVVIVNDSSPGVTWFASVAGNILEFLLSGFFMAILVVFMLVKREDLRNRFFLAVGHSQLALMTRAIDLAAQRISSYLMTQLFLNLGFGLLWSLCLLFAPNGEGGYGIPYALLWGALVAALRFVPYVGSWLALAFPLLLSIALSPVGHPFFQALVLIGVFAGLELLTANVFEPLLFGRHAGVSPVALLIAAVFWSWLWGPIGLVLSTPLTVCLVVLGKYVPQLQLLNIFLGPEQPPATETSYYQRLLVRDEDEATEIIQAHLKERPADSVYDDLLLAALALARRDAERGTLGAGAEHFILEVTRRAVDEIVGPPEHAGMIASGKGEPAGPNHERVLVLGCPARGESDELALYMLGQLLRAKNYQADLMSADALTSEVVEKVRQEEPVVACISALPPGGLAQASYLCKRLRLHFPDLKIFVGRWGQRDDVEKMKDRLTDAGATKVVTSLLEMRQEVVPLLRLERPEPAAINTHEPEAIGV